jgi:purine-binding chemotaxis protein CheW
MTTTTLQRTTDTSATAEDTRPAGGKYLTFKLVDEEYGVAILKVREINGRMDITAVPQMPPYMKGVINLRGKVLPAIDLRLKFGLPEAEPTDQTCIIVVDVGREMGIIVDTVSEVVDIPAENIDPPPRVAAAVDTAFIRGMGKVGESVKILLEIDRVLDAEQINELSTAAAQADGTEAPSGGTDADLN